MLRVLVACAVVAVAAGQGLQACLSSAGLQVVTSSSASWQNDIAAYNRRVPYTPAAVVTPSSPQQVASALSCARSSNVKVAAKSGGHSYANDGNGGQAGSLVVNLSSFRAMEWVTFQGEQLAKVGGGNRIGDIALFLNAQGKAIPHGVCPYVGVGGQAGLGGFGYTSRMWGLTLDYIAAYDVVLANGTAMTGLTPTQDPDLFWALNGAAPSFGIITSYYFRTEPIPTSTIRFVYSYNPGTLTAESAASILSAFQSFGTNAPVELGTMALMGPGGSLTISGIYYGQQAPFEAAITPLLNSIPTGWTADVRQLGWIDSVRNTAGDQSLNTSLAADNRDTFFAKSLMVPTATPLTNASWLSFASYLINSNTNTNWFIEANLYGGAGSLINADSPNSSFGHRDQLLTFQLYASSASYGPPYPEDGITFVNGMVDAIVEPMGGAFSYGAYVNYADPTLGPSEWPQRYYGSQYSRLSNLKARYDPGNLLSAPQAIVGNAQASTSTSTRATTTPTIQGGASTPTQTQTGEAARARVGAWFLPLSMGMVAFALSR